jgi:arsenate reductase-like glutaredoxin family protein
MDVRPVGRPEMIAPPIRSYIGKILNLHPFKSSKDIAHQLLLKKGIAVTSRCVRLHLNSLNYKNSKPVLVPHLIETHINRRIQWCKNHGNFDWERVLFTDETSIEVGGYRGVQWHRNGHRPTAPRRKFPNKVMFWGGISTTRKTELLVISGSMNGEKYVETLRVILSKLPKGFKKKMVFQQDGASCHTCRQARDFFTEQEINMLDWPANSPDLNPIENIWSILKDKVSKRCPESREDVVQFAMEEWDALDMDLIKASILSMPSRIDQVSTRDGKKCDY